MYWLLASKTKRSYSPRNVHKSVISSIILSGAEPVYIQPRIDHEYGMAMGLEVQDVRSAVRKTLTQRLYL